LEFQSYCTKTFFDLTTIAEPLLIQQLKKTTDRENPMKKKRTVQVSLLVRQIVRSILIPAGAFSVVLPAAAGLNPSRLYVADSSGYILKLDLLTHKPTPVCFAGGMPYSLVFEGKKLIASDTTGRLMEIDPVTGQLRVICDNSTGLLGSPFGIALTPQEELLVTNGRQLLAVNPVNGHIRVVASGGLLLAPVAVAVSDTNKDEAYIVNRAWPSQIVRVNTRTGEQALVTQGIYLNGPSGIVVRKNDIYVTAVADPSGNFGYGWVVHIDASSGLQDVVSGGQDLVLPIGIAFGLDGTLILADDETNLTVNENKKSGVVAIDPITSDQTLILLGSGNCINMRGICVVSADSPDKQQGSLRYTNN